MRFVVRQNCVPSAFESIYSAIFVGKPQDRVPSRQQCQIESQWKRHRLQRHRTVIVDNPFGKASSDHVLDPVFFIAEQLGFQIIALTAHAEGKFIRTYFPIVYSCRLREANNGVSQIMTKEKEIKKAFFKDSDPQALMRLGQLQQLGLFEY